MLFNGKPNFCVGSCLMLCFCIKFAHGCKIVKAPILKGDSRTFYEFFKFAMFVLLLMATVWKKYSKIFSRFSFCCNPREKHSDN